MFDQQKFKNLRAAILAVTLLSVATALISSIPAQAGARLIRLATDERVGKLSVVLGTSEAIRVTLPFAELMVSDPDTAEVNALTNKTFYVQGKKLGTTNITLFDEKRRLVAVIDVEITHDLSGMREAMHDAIPNANIHVRSLNGRVLLEGVVPSAPAAAKAMAIARDFAGNDVTDTMNVAANQQVNLEVRMVEVNRQAGKELGISWNATNSNGNGFASGNNPPNVPSGAGVLYQPFATLIANVLSNGFAPDIVINALEQRKVARRLAEPNLTAISGQSASFHAGGEVPINTCHTDSTGKLQCDTQYKEFGVKLGFTPTVLDDGLINLAITPEVSEIDQTLTNLSTNSYVFVTRKASTTVELRDGQSFAIAGLLQSNNTRKKDQVPWLGDVPVLGTLFRSAAFQKKESDLVIIVTPRLVHPVGNRQELHDPLQNPLSSNEPELFLLGKLEVSRKSLDQTYHGQYGHIIDLPKVNYGNVQK